MAHLLGVDRRRYYEWVAAARSGWSDREWRLVALADRVGQLWEASDSMGRPGFTLIWPPKTGRSA